MSTKTKAWLNLALFLLTIGVNALGAFGLRVLNKLCKPPTGNKM